MDAQQLDPQRLLGRIATLERAHRRTRRMFMASFGGLSLLLLVAAATPHVYRAQKFELVSADGTPRAELSVNAQGGSRLVFFDAKKRARLNLSVEKNGRAGVVIYDSKSKARAALSTRADESPTFVLYDKRGQARTTAAMHKDGRPILFFSNKKGKVISMLPKPGSR
ncbi:MAG: hypothetical protein JRH20_11990 [Deltaproteobacteria bacterium]|nr:hypothetical protein [Deltaproteobacteria bacterium]